MIRPDPFRSVDRLTDHLRRLSAMRAPLHDRWPDWAPTRADITFDLVERDDDYLFVADLPGFDEDDIDLRYDDGTLTLTATYEASAVTSTPTTRMRRVIEQIPVPDDTDATEIDAAFRNGVLEVSLPRMDTSASDGTRIPIDDAGSASPDDDDDGDGAESADAV